MKHKLFAGLDVAVESICYTLLAYLLLSALFSMKHNLLYIPLMALYAFVTGQYLQSLEKHIPRPYLRWLLLAVCFAAVLAVSAAAGYLRMEFVPFSA